MKKLGIVLAVLAAIALVYAPVMAADKAAAPAAPAAEKAPAKKAAEKPAVKKEKPAKEATTVTGTVTEVKSKKGKVTVAIQTDKDTITVISKGKGAELAKMVGKKVEAKGKLNVSKKGKKSFYVFEYKEAM